jgi:hypothetical protein
VIRKSWDTCDRLTDAAMAIRFVKASTQIERSLKMSRKVVETKKLLKAETSIKIDDSPAAPQLIQKVTFGGFNSKGDLNKGDEKL